MLQLAKTLSHLKSDTRAVTALEYAVLAGIIVVAVTAGFAALGTGILAKIGSALA